MLIAIRVLDLGNGNRREIGDPVPEAASWRNLSSYISQHYVLDVPNQPPLPFEKHSSGVQVRIARHKIKEKLIGLGILARSDGSVTKTVLEVGRELAGDKGRITTQEIDTATLEPISPLEVTPVEPEEEPVRVERKKKAEKKGKKR